MEQQQPARSAKVYVSVTVKYDPDGGLTPVSLIWEDGRCFEINRVLEQRRAASLKAGGAGLRFLCMIGGKSSYLYFEDNARWFVERREST